MPDIAVAHATSPRISAYPWSSGFGTKYSDPGTLPTGTGYGVAWFSGGSPPPPASSGNLLLLGVG